MPVEYQVRQSLANATRYITAQLKEAESRVLGAQEVLAHLEADLLQRVVAEVGHMSRRCAGGRRYRLSRRHHDARRRGRRARLFPAGRG